VTSLLDLPDELLAIVLRMAAVIRPPPPRNCSGGDGPLQHVLTINKRLTRLSMSISWESFTVLEEQDQDWTMARLFAHRRRCFVRRLVYAIAPASEDLSNRVLGSFTQLSQLRITLHDEGTRSPPTLSTSLLYALRHLRQLTVLQFWPSTTPFVLEDPQSSFTLEHALPSLRNLTGPPCAGLQALLRGSPRIEILNLDTDDDSHLSEGFVPAGHINIPWTSLRNLFFTANFTGILHPDAFLQSLAEALWPNVSSDIFVPRHALTVSPLIRTAKG
jgi:hypothetical protein